MPGGFLELGETLERAEAKIWSCGCPYLAFSEETGYMSAFAATHDPVVGLSNLGRIGVTDCLRTAGFSTFEFDSKLLLNRLSSIEFGILLFC